MKTNRHVSLLKRYFSNFSVFDKLKDIQTSGVSTSSSSHAAKEEAEPYHESVTEKKEMLKRKPSKKVLQLVDDILNLTLIEAADLCELCQEKLEGNKNFNNSQFVNRSPFPHPSSFFGTSNWNGSMPPGGFNPLGIQQLQQLQQNVAIGSSESNSMQGQTKEQQQGKEKEKEKGMEKGKEKEKEKGKEESQQKKITKSTFGVKLEKFDPKNKINTIKEIRKITNVGLKEAKDMVESAPVYIQKGVPAEEANEMKKKFESLGAVIILD